MITVILPYFVHLVLRSSEDCRLNPHRLTKLIKQLLSLKHVRDFNGAEDLLSATANKFSSSCIIKLQLELGIGFTIVERNMLCPSPFELLPGEVYPSCGLISHSCSLQHWCAGECGGCRRDLCSAPLTTIWAFRRPRHGSQAAFKRWGWALCSLAMCAGSSWLMTQIAIPVCKVVT